MRPTARQRRPRPRRAGRAGRGGSEAELSSPARHGAASLLRRRSLLPPPPPSRSLVLAGAAQTCSGAAAPARIGTGLRPRDPATGVGGCFPPDWAPRRCQVKACPGAGGRGSAKGQQGVRSLRVSSERCAPLLGAHCRLPSPALYLSLLPSPLLPSFSPFYSPLVSFHSAFSLPVCCLCPFPPSPPPFSLPVALSFLISTCSLPFSSSTLLSFPVFFFFSPFPALLPFLSSSLPAILFPTPLSFSFSWSRLPLWSPASPRRPSSLGRERAVRCVPALGEEGCSHSYLRVPPPTRGGEGGDSSGKGPL